MENCLIEDDNRLYVYVDESGSINKTNISNNRYFVVAMVFTRNPVVIRRLYRTKISSLMKKSEKYRDAILFKKEIKGKSISETTKMPVYQHIVDNASDIMEVGIIALDNKYTSDKFIENHARTFNYLIQVYLDSCFRKHSKFMTGRGKIDFIIDEQNIATGAKYNLEEYLNQQLTMVQPVCSEFSVGYCDSKNEKLVQLADFIANTFYRNIEKKNLESRENVKMWLPLLCNGDIFDFSEAHDIALNLPQ